MADESEFWFKKRVRISQQMQVRIPIELYERYGFGREAECVATPTGVEFRPVKSPTERNAELLEQLVAEGLSGEELIEAFRHYAAEDGEDAGYLGDTGYADEA